MEKDIKNIPTPSRDAQAAWLRAGTGNHKLVYVSGRWQVLKVGNIPSGAVTFEEWTAVSKTNQPKSKSDVDVSKNAPSYQSSKAREKDPLGQYVTQDGIATSVDDNGNLTLRDKDGNERYVYLETDGTLNISTDYDAIRKKVLADYQSSPGGLNSLFTLLYNKRLISQETLNNKSISADDFTKGLQYVIRKYGIDVFDKRDINKQYTVSTFNQFLTGNTIPSVSGGGAGGAGTFVSRRETTRLDAYEEANDFFMNWAGRPATEKEKIEYFNTLSAAEKNAFTKRTVTEKGTTQTDVETGSLITESDKLMMLGKIAGKAIAGTDMDTLLKGGSKTTQNINTLKTYASNYGIDLSDSQALSYVVESLNTGKDLESTKSKIQKLSKIKYSNIANFIDDDTSVKDIASDFMYSYAQLTGTPYESISLNNEIIQKALANNGNEGVMRKPEFEYLIRTSPKTKQFWLDRQETKEEASGYANSILRMFGLMA